MKNIRYKLTDQNMQTYNNFQWELGVWKEATGKNTYSCTDGVLHYYADPLLANLFNPIHANYSNPRLFRIEIDKELNSDGLKGWSKKQRLIEEI